MTTTEPETLFRFVEDDRRLVLIRTSRPRDGFGELRIEATPRTSVTVTLRPEELDLLAVVLTPKEALSRCLGCGGDLVKVGMSRVYLGGTRYAYTCQTCGWIHSQVEEK